MTTINNSNIKPAFFIFGNKGSVWTNTVHIARKGDPVTFCGVPMLSSNHGRDEQAGCPHCLVKYKELTGE
jgi:hypothetical protein